MTAEDTNNFEENIESLEHEEEPTDQGATARGVPKKAKLPSRNTVARQERRLRSEAKKTRKRRLYTAGGSLIAIALIAGLVLPSIGGGVRSGSDNQDVVVKELVGTQIAIQPGGVVSDTSSISYSTTPPTSGPRLELAADWGVHDKQISDGQAVRNLEYGAVIFNHGLSDADAVKLADFARQQPGYPGCLLVNPHNGLDSGEVVMTSWGWLQETKVDDQESMQAFVDDHLNKGPLFMGSTCGASG